MARGAALRGLPDELPAMAALAETGVANIRSPDQRYVGYFQMDVKLWNSGAYRGYPRNPELQLRWFTDYAVLVRQRKIAEGDADFGRDEARWGRWVGIVENPGAPAVNHYARRLEEAQALVAGDCLPTGAAPDSTPRPRCASRPAAASRAAISVRARCPAESCVAAAARDHDAGKARGRARALAAHAPAKTTTFTIKPRGKSASLRIAGHGVDEAGNATSGARNRSPSHALSRRNARPSACYHRRPCRRTRASPSRTRRTTSTASAAAGRSLACPRGCAASRAT